MSTFELDQFKNSWKQQSIDYSLEDRQIKAAINKKSSTLVKYIFWISCMEFVLIFLSNFIFNDPPPLNHLSGEKLESYQFWSTITEYLYRINALISFVFMFIFYKKYKQISTSLSISENIERIIGVRKLVHYFVMWNLLLSLFYVFTVGKYISVEFLVYKGVFQENTPSYWGVLLGIGIFILGITYLYYQLIFGIFLKKLKNNLKILKS